MFNLAPAASEVRRLVVGVPGDSLGEPTPCADWTVGELLAHIHQFTAVFAANARKQPPSPPQDLVDDWRTAIPAALDELAQAWSDEFAWEGEVSAGGIEMTAADNALVCSEELTVHGWDLAQATGQEPVLIDADLDRVEEFFERFGDEPFGRAAEVDPHAARWERVIARTGRDPRWTG